MRVVVLIGVEHKFQRGIAKCELDASVVSAFREFLKDLCSRYQISAIAEEMSMEGLQRFGNKESIAQQVCADLALSHQFSDPDADERSRLGILPSNAIRATRFFDDWTDDQIEDEVQERGDPARERYWWRMIANMDKWPLLFICGAWHFESFSKLLRENGVEVVEYSPDWQP